MRRLAARLTPGPHHAGTRQARHPHPTRPAPARRHARSLPRAARRLPAEPLPSLQERRQDLRALHRLLLENREALVDAVNQDFGCRSRFETLMTELLQGQEAALDAIRHVPQLDEGKGARSTSPSTRWPAPT
jgi:acyl-CoA reductase-like NAD-dependent aldehyde dehydrogenase